MTDIYMMNEHILIAVWNHTDYTWWM